MPRWAALCRQRDICPPVDMLVAAYLGWERPVRETPVAVDSPAEDAAFASAMQEFGTSRPASFGITDIIKE